MKNSSPASSVLALLLLGIAASASAAPQTHTRDYRPLAAKAVRIQLSGSALKGGKAAAKTREGWAHFDRKEWEPAMDAFLSALELNAADASAAEGLTMAVYRSGDRISAAELGEEFSTAMPWIRGMVVETLLVDVTVELKRDELAKLDALVERLPYAGGAYNPVRDLVGESAGKKEVGKSVVSAPTAAPLTTDLAIHSATMDEVRPAMLVAQPLGGN